MASVATVAKVAKVAKVAGKGKGGKGGKGGHGGQGGHGGGRADIDVDRRQVLARLGLGDVAYDAPVLLTLSKA